MEKNCVSIAFTGDIGFDKYMDGKWEDAQLLSEEILDFFKPFCSAFKPIK